MPAQKWWQNAHTNSSMPSFTGVAARYWFLIWLNPCSEVRLVSSRNSSHAANGKNSSAPEMRCRIETQPGTGSRISNRSAGRLRYFGRSFFAAALGIFGGPAPTTGQGQL